MQTSHCFTVRSNGGLLRVLQTQCQVVAAFDPKAPPTPLPTFVPFNAIWDTGASGTVITQAVITACALQPMRMTQVHDASGTRLSNVYLVNIGLPNGVGVPSVQVTTGILPSGTDVLIGMDIITFGDFSITNKGGTTVFSFRYPSELQTDFVKEHNARQTRAGSQFGNGPLPGSPPRNKRKHK